MMNATQTNAGATTAPTPTNDDRQPQATQRGRGGRRGGKGRNISDRNRDRVRKDNFREVKSTEYQNDLRSETMKNLLIDDAEQERMRAQLKKVITSRITAPISTRGTGILTTMTCAAAQILRQPVPFQDIPLLPMYRVALAMFQQKYARVCLELGPSVEGHFPRKGVSVNVEIECRLSEVGRIPKPLQMLIDCIGTYSSHNEEVTFLPCDQYHHGLLLPDSGNILLENLRATVLSLSNPQVPIVYRRAFIDENPIPFAHWQNNLLMNADAIMPPNYVIDVDLRDDVRLVRAFFQRIEKPARDWLTPYTNSGTKGRPEASIVHFNVFCKSI